MATFDRDNRADPTSYAIICHGLGIPDVPSCGIVFLSEEQYTQQLSRPDSKWYCPQCGGSADWDDNCRATNPPDEDN